MTDIKITDIIKTLEDLVEYINLYSLCENNFINELLSVCEFVIKDYKGVLETAKKIKEYI